MRLAIAIGVTKNTQFRVALDRIFQEQKVLQSRLKPIEVAESCSILSIVISDHPANYFKRVEHDDNRGIYQVIVGYDESSNYPQSEDSKVIHMFAGWLQRVFHETEGYSNGRAELQRIVSDWEETVVRSLGSDAMTKT